MSLDTPSGLFALSDFAEHTDGSGLAWEAFQEVDAHITALRAALDQSRAHVRELKAALRAITFARYSDLTMADVERIALAALVAANAEEVADSE